MFPGEMGFIMPAEWSRHMGTLMEWPVQDAGWLGPFDEVLEAFADVARKIAAFEPVIMIARPDLADTASKMCGPEVKILTIDHDDSWMRDNGPTFIVNNQGELAGIDWRFNAWGGKYPFEKDNLVASKVLHTLEIPCFSAPLIMEGGSIHVDGEGTLLTTEECLLNTNRNKHMTREEIETELKQYLNVEKVLWLKKGLYGDDTDGHIDNVACFARPGVILIQTASSPENPNYERSRHNLEVLRNSTDARGRKFEIIEIEQPAQAAYEDTHLTLSYINFYFVNGGIILPVFGGEHEETDRNAEKILKRTFTDRKVVTVNGMPIIRGGGNVHCITQQVPYGIPAKINL